MEFIADTIQNLTHLELTNTLSESISIIIEERELLINPHNEELWNKNFTKIDSCEKIEVFKTLNFLYTKFQNLFPQIQEKFGISEEIFLWNISKQLANQIEEAKINGRKFTNGTIGSLKKIGESGDFTLEKIPYWAFGSVNVSLDAISYNTNQWKKTLRELMESFEKQDKNGEFYLPNSLGVSVLIQLHDGTIIAQKRNNKKVLTQYAGLTASASWAVSIFGLQDGWVEILTSNAIAEITEEVWIDIKHTSYMPENLSITWSIQSCLLRELHIHTNSGILMPLGVVMERKRHNPEVIFTMILKEGITLGDIEKKWEQAEDKWESIWLVWVDQWKIKNDLTYYLNQLPDHLKNDPIGLEKFIQTLSRDQDWIGPHLLMSHLAWVKAISKLKEKERNTVLDIIRIK